MKKKKSRPKNASEFENVLARVAELEETLRAIRRGEVDAVVVTGPTGHRELLLQRSESCRAATVEPCRGRGAGART